MIWMHATKLAISHSPDLLYTNRTFATITVDGSAANLVEGDLVLRLKLKGHHKLESPWEGPYIIHEIIGGAYYRLRDPDTGGVYKNPWNVALLRKFYAYEILLYNKAIQPYSVLTIYAIRPSATINKEIFSPHDFHR